MMATDDQLPVSAPMLLVVLRASSPVPIGLLIWGDEPWSGWHMR
jgi:hypothetical protein